MTRYQLHVQKWNGCNLCHLSERRDRVCHLRGKIPCDVLFVGEAPGKSEDVLGRPFVGPAGQLLDQIISEAFKEISLCSICGKIQELSDSQWTCSSGHGFEDDVDSRAVRIAFTNLVGCAPIDAEGKIEQPSKKSILTCFPRLQELLKICQPKIVIRVGQLSTDYLSQGNKHFGKMLKKLEMIDIVHPAAILRASTAQRGLMIRRAVVILRKGIEKIGT